MNYWEKGSFNNLCTSECISSVQVKSIELVRKKAKVSATFIEGETLKNITPLPDGKAMTVRDTVNDLEKLTGVSEVSIRRDIQKLIQLVEFRGAPKTGGYFLTDYMLSKLDKK